MSFWGEIRRRKVFQVAAVYAVVAWLLVQIVATIEQPLNLPEWFDTAVIVLLAVGFPITLIVSWAFNFTSAGLIRDPGGVASNGGRTIEYALIGLVVVAVGWLFFRVEFDGGVGSAGNVLADSIAVLPCANLSPNPDNAYFALGLHEEILNQLFKIRQLNVTARTSVMQYADVARPMSEIAAELSVESVMECSVSYGDDRVAISAQLIDGATGIHLWSERYNREFRDVFGIQADIAMNVANALRVEFFDEEREQIERVSTSSREAYERYLEARTLNPGTGDYTRIEQLMDEAIGLDPEFAEAWSTKASSLSVGLISAAFSEDERRARLAQAVEAADRAIDLAPDQAHGYRARGLARLTGRDWLGAELDWRAARERGSSDFEGSISLLSAGYLERAREAFEQSLQSDPRNDTVHYYLMMSHEVTGDSEAADAAYRLGARLFPNGFVLGHVARVWVRLGRGEVGTGYDPITRGAPNEFLQFLDDAEGGLAELDRVMSAPADPGPANLTTRAVWAAYFGDAEYALQLLDRGVSETRSGSGTLMFMAWLPVFEEMRQLPGFRDLLRRIGLVEYWQTQGWPDICSPRGDEDFVCS